jgi:hypothetical protein
MDSISKCLSSLLIVALLVSSSLLIIQFADAQPITKPSVPEFTLKLVSHPYDVAPETTIDPYTGKTVITQHGYHVENKTVEITIKNQALPKLSDSNYLYYNVSYKGLYENDWKYFGYSQYEPLITQSNSDYTIVNFENIPVEGQMDFRVQAQIGYYLEIFYPMQFMDTHFYTFTGEVSGWSPTQTMTIPETSTSTSPTPIPTYAPTPTPSVTSPTPTDSLPNDGPTSPPNTTSDLTLTWVIIGVLVISAVSLLLYVKHLRKINQDSKS